jgi:ubiquinone/menaquinone biosynthesis C-methylase UbiE
MANENAVVVEAWNTILFEKFYRFRHLLTVGLGAHSDAAFAQRPFGEGARVLDLGCGFGDTTMQIARAVGTEGSAVGVDCADNFVAAAREDAQASGARNAEFFAADVQFDDLRGPYDHAFSRFGTMFFNMPGAALRNVRRVLRLGGELTMIVWRKREDNPWLHAAEQKVRELVPVVSHDETDQVHCGPGPFSMAGADTTSDLLRSAGYDRVRFERSDADICIGRDLDEAIEFAMALGPAGEVIRLAGDEGREREPEVRRQLREVLTTFRRGDGSVWAPSSTWIVRARNPPGAV